MSLPALAVALGLGAASVLPVQAQNTTSADGTTTGTSGSGITGTAMTGAAAPAVAATRTDRDEHRDYGWLGLLGLAGLYGLRRRPAVHREPNRTADAARAPS